MSIKEAIETLLSIAKQSKFGMDTNVLLCLLESGIEYQQIKGIRHEPDDDGSVCIVDVDIPDTYFCRTVEDAEEALMYFGLKSTNLK